MPIVVEMIAYLLGMNIDIKESVSVISCNQPKD